MTWPGGLREIPPVNFIGGIIMHITFTKEIPYRDSTLNGLDFDLDSLTGNDLIQVEESLRKTSPNAPLWGTQHIIYIAAKSAHIPPDVLKGLTAKDFMQVYMTVSNFFGGMVSEDSQQEASEG